MKTGKMPANLIFRILFFTFAIFLFVFFSFNKYRFTCYAQTEKITPADKHNSPANSYKESLVNGHIAFWAVREPLVKIWKWAEIITYENLRNLPENLSFKPKKRRMDNIKNRLSSLNCLSSNDSIQSDFRLKPLNNDKRNNFNNINRPKLDGDSFYDDFNRPEMVGRMRKDRGNFLIPMSKQTGVLSNKSDSHKTPFLENETDRFHKKLSYLSRQSGDFSIDRNNKDDNQNEEDSPTKKEKRKRWYRRESLCKEKKVKNKEDKRELKTLTLEDTEGPQRINIKADEVRYHRGITTARGNVTVENRGVKIKADKIQYNKYSKEILADGKVTIQKGEDGITGSSLKYNPVTLEADIKDAYGHAKDIAVGDVKLKRTIFFWGKQVQWKQGVICIKKGAVTSCDLPPPDSHYRITGEEIIIYPKEKMIVRNARFFLGKSQLLGLKNMVFPLRQRDPRTSQSFIPKIGRNEQEGLYVKEAVSYLWGKKDYGVLHLDWFRKVGIGAGIEHYYHLGDRGAGKVYYYRMGSSTSPTNRYNFTNRVYYKFPNNFFVSLNYSSERYEYPEYSSPNIKNVDFYVSHFTDKTRTALHIQDYILGSNRNYGFNFLNRYEINERLHSQMVVDYLSSETSLKRLYRLNTLGRLVQRGDVFDSSLTFDYTWGDRKFYVNRQPEVAIRSRDFKAGPIDYRVSMAVGSFREMPSDISTIRSDIKLSMLNKVYPISSSTDFSVAGGLRQLLYEQGHKKYIVRTHANLEQKLGKNISVLATHYFQDKEGHSPIALDYFDDYNVMGGTLEYCNLKNLRMQLTGGYDLEHKQYQSMIPRLEYCPTIGSRMIFSSNYDVKHKQWMNIDGEVGMKLSKQVGLKYWGLYDLNNKRMTYQNYVVEFDSHDFATRFIYKGSQGEVWLSATIKGFPYDKIEVGPDEDRNIVDKSLLERAPDEEDL
ncbi:MAG: hypothetical protein K8T10_17765 [Candidatus Eremiobacteraeota bacterium]|nr:hypothetical protein [Candidatus Eremiobacteraeota bacterium]